MEDFQDTKKELAKWDGNVSLIHRSEIVCKMLYEKFYAHTEVSVILGDWKSVLHEQQQYSYTKSLQSNFPSTQIANLITVHNYDSSLEASSGKRPVLSSQATISSTPPSTLHSESQPSLPSKSSSSAAPLSTSKLDPSTQAKLLSLPVGEPSRDLMNAAPKRLWSNTEPALPSSMIPLSPLAPTSAVSFMAPSEHTKYRPLFEQGSRFVTSSKSGVVSVLGTGMFECIIFPYFSSFSVPKREAKYLHSIFGGGVADRIDTFIRDEYQGEQPVGSAFIMETHSQPCKFIVCVSLSRDASYVPQDYAYNGFRAALLALHTFNKFNPEHQITAILCPAFEAPHVSPFSVASQMAICYEYWNWRIYPSGTLSPITEEMRKDICAKISAKVVPGIAPVQAYLEKLVASKLLASRGFVYETELNVFMSWLDGTVPSPFPRDELAKLFIKIVKNPGLAPFTLTSAHMYSNMTPTVLEFILDLSKRNQLKLFEDITVEDLRWGEPLAQGTSGRVYKGEWKHQPVAIKKFFVADPPIIRNELGLISVLKHPNLVECFGGFVSDGTALFVTELMDCNLFELLRTKTTLDFGTKIKLAIDIAEGMTFLHSRNIIHRDLKSVNVLIQLGTIDMVAKVCDFGLSRVIDNGTKMTGNVGTIAWIAPEVFQNKKYSEMCDVYSFGVILYELLTHTTPFKELASFRIPSAVVKGKRPTLPTDALNVPKAYLSLMKHCWHQNPAKRPPFSEILKILGSLAPSNIIGPTSSYNFSASTTSESESIDMDDSTRTDSSEFMYGTYQDMEEQVFTELKARWIAKAGNYSKDPLLSDTTLLKCLRARKHSVVLALKLLSSYAAWYRYLNQGNPLSVLLVRPHLEKKILYTMQTVDLENRPILLFNAAQYYVDKFPVIDFIRTLVYYLERLTESDETQKSGITLIANTANWTMANLSYRNATAFFESFKNSFPISVKQILLVDSPGWMPRVLSLISPVIGKLMSKIVFVTQQQLLKYVSVDNLPPELGGTSQFDMDLWIRSRYETEKVEYSL